MKPETKTTTMIQNLHFTRSLTRSLAIAALAIFMFLPGKGWGQTLLTWNTFGNAGTETTEPSTTNDANITSAILTQGTITAAANGNRFGGSGWFNTGNTLAGNTLAEAIAGNDYIQFIVTPNSGFSFTPTSFVFSWDRSTSGPKNVTLRSSVDAYSADLGTITNIAALTFNPNTITITGLTNITVATTFRLYGYGATATGGTGGFDVSTNVVNVQLNGTTASTCTPPTAPSTSGASRCNAGTVALSASGAVTGEDYKWYDAATGGTLKQTGGSTYSPSVSSTTDYYVSIYNTTTLCESATRTKVTATVVSSATSIAPTATQNIGASVNGTKLTVTEGSTPTSRVWKYGTLSGTYPTSSVITATDYYPNFASAGTYFVVCESTYPAPCGVVTSNEVQINVVSDAITLTTSPQNFGPFCNATANSVNLSYTTTGTVTSPFIELSAVGGGFPGTNIGGTVTGTGPYTITANIPAAQQVGAYRIRIKSTDATPVLSADNGSDITVTAALTPTISVTASPACAGTTLTFTATVTNGGATPSYQWKKNPGTGYVNVGSNLATYSPTAGTNVLNGDLVQCILTSNATCVTTTTATSNEFTAVVNVVPDAVTVSSAGTFCGSTTLTATGGTNGTIYWQNTTNNGVSTATASSSQSVSATGTYYFRSYSGTCWGTQGSAAVTINTTPGFGTQPTNQTVTAPATATFSISGVTGTISGYQWQVNTGSGWADVTDGTGGTTTSYTTSATLTSMTGYQYRCIVKATLPCIDVTSNSAFLTVNTAPCGGTESFTNASLPTSNGNGSFVGDVISWSYVSCRAEDAYGITGKGCMLGSTSSAKLTSGSLSGIGNFTCKLKKGFTGTGTRQVALYINGVLKANSIAWDNTTTQTFSVNNINIAGAVVIEIRNLTSFNAVLDDIAWTCYNPPTTPTANSATSISSSGFTANWNTVAGATGYKLDVSPVNSFYTVTTPLQENFTGFSAGTHASPSGTAINGSLDGYTQVTGWTGTQVYQAGGEVKMGSGSNAGIITTPTIDLSSASVSFSFDLQDYGDGSTVEVLHAPDGVTFSSVTTFAAPSTKTNQVVTLSGGTANSKLRIQAISASSQRYFLDNIQVVKTVNNSITGYNDLSVAGTSQVVTGLLSNKNYYYQIRATSANGTSANSNTITVTTDSKPTAYAMTGGGAYCAGGLGVAVGLSDSELGVDYTLIKDGTPTATVIVGDGNAISFGLQLFGTYTASGTSNGVVPTIDGTTAMTSTAVVSATTLVTPTFAQLGPYCVGDIPGTLPLTSTELITGTWNAPISTTSDGSTVYTFTPTAGQCATTATMTVVVNATPGAPTVSVTQPTCLLANGSVSITSSTAGLTFSFNGGTYTVDASPYTVAANAIYSIIAKNGSGCLSEAATGTMGAQPAGPSASIPLENDAAYESNLYTFDATASGGTILWTWQTLNGNLGLSTFPNPANVEDPVFTPKGSGSIKFTLTVTGAPGCGTATDNITLWILGTNPIIWSGNVNETEWDNAGNWAQGIIPTSALNVKIPANATRFPDIATTGATCHNIQVENGASLIDNGKLAITGQLTVEHPAISASRWHFISSPVSGAVSGMFTGDYLYEYATGGTYTPILSTSQSLDAMVGYALYPKTNPYTSAYVGGLNPTSNSFTVSGAGSGDQAGWNLVGNPYTSAIDWAAASGWSKPVAVDNATYIVSTTTTNWKSYVNGVGNNEGSRYIAPTQGFFVHATGAGTLAMTNDVQVHNPVTFSKKSEAAVTNLVRLEVSGNEFRDEAVVRFTTEATPEFDGNYDALKLYGYVTEAAQLYTLGSIPLAINSLPETGKVPVGIKVGTNGSYTIAATEINDMPYVTLEDNETGIYTNLSDEPYTFEAVAGTFDQRFILHFSMLSVEETKKASATVYSYQQTVHINLKDQVKGDIFIYNIAGQLVSTKRAAQGTNEIKLPNVGNYIVKVITKDNTVVRKVFIQ